MCLSKVETRRSESIWIVTINRPESRNAVDAATAAELAAAFRQFDADATLDVAILTGAGGTFCAGADLKAIASGQPNDLRAEGDGPMGPTRMLLSKPVIAAIEGHAVAGGLELALWCDLRVVARDATLGVFCRRFGVPLIDLGTVRLPRLIGQSHALDLILTGRGVDGAEAWRMGLANRLVESGQALAAALEVARALAGHPQTCMRSDRLSCYEQWGLAPEAALRNEFERGLAVLGSGESRAGARRFTEGAGRHGRTADLPSTSKA
ncbi:MAG TPA: crotonase/enoyl-CoA hydratase family protein [Bryobacteraceae bacterium]|nr:crotonase/enoyl-CoA hydratase family protein [Bryobacteraceae bacterium]